MTDCRTSVLVELYECQIVTELPAGGGDNGGRGGCSVGVTMGVPDTGVGVGDPIWVVEKVALSVGDLVGVREGCGEAGVELGKEGEVLVNCGPG